MILDQHNANMLKSLDFIRNSDSLKEQPFYFEKSKPEIKVRIYLITK